MKKIIYKLTLLFSFVALLASCEEEVIVYDTTNGESFSGFQTNSPSPLVFNPVEDTENVYTIGVSTVSTVDRAVEISVASTSSLDPSFYTIETLNPVIPAGELSTDIVITTPAADSFPADGSSLVLNLESVEGAELPSFSWTTQTLGFTVQCPTVDLSGIPGTYNIVSDAFGTSVGDSQFEIVAGPGENEFTMVNPFDHPNPSAGGAQNYEVVFSVNPNSGNVNVSRQEAWHCDNFGCSYGQGFVDGSGLALTCIDQIDLDLRHTVGAGSFGTYALRIKKSSGSDSDSPNDSANE